MFKEMIFVEGGSFTMGCSDEQGGDCRDNEKPTSQVTVSSFYIMKYEVTQELYQEVMGKKSSYFNGDNLPVECVKWYDTIEFCNALSLKEGFTPVYNKDNYTVSANWCSNGYRLPTEAEWEYAARGGNQSKGYKYSGSNNADDVGWYSENSRDKTHLVGTKQANELDIYDMSGNVFEWCWDWYYDYTAESKTNPRGASSGSYRVLRSGSWDRDAVDLRSTYRNSNHPACSGRDVGFRVVRNAE